MNKILRNLKENWITYGFETLVVIVGVLGSISLNSWNEQRKIQKLERQYLQRLLVDLKTDSQYFAKREKNSSDRSEELTTFLIDIKKEQQSLESAKELVSRVQWNHENLSVSNSTYNDLLSTGNLNIIKDERIRIGLLKYHDVVDRSLSVFDDWRTFSSQNQLDVFNAIPQLGKLYDFNLDVYPESELTQLDWNFFNKPRSRERLMLELGASSFRFQHDTFKIEFQELNILAIELIKSIENELTNDE